MSEHHPYSELPRDPSGFWADQDLISELRKEGSELSLRAANTIAWLREEMIDPMEYMRVSNERGAALVELHQLKGEVIP